MITLSQLKSILSESEDAFDISLSNGVLTIAEKKETPSVDETMEIKQYILIFEPDAKFKDIDGGFEFSVKYMSTIKLKFILMSVFGNEYDIDFTDQVVSVKSKPTVEEKLDIDSVDEIVKHLEELDKELNIITSIVVESDTHVIVETTDEDKLAVSVQIEDAIIELFDGKIAITIGE